ncbi:MAG: hypothetical protein JWP37_3254 [Mucilaginibacter sp.]|nr:hypothetical protein [Mucilaginibacter sp.]
MNPTLKKIFLISTVVVPFLIYCVYYYGMMIKNAPYKFTEFESIVIQYGPRDSMINKYNSKTGDYQYLDSHNSLVKKHLHLPQAELLYLHHKAAELGFWDFPAVELGDTTIKHEGPKPLRFLIEFNYKRKSKKVLYDASFNGPVKLVEANEQMVKEIMKVLDEEEGKEKN